MSTPVSSGYFVELGEYSLILAKTNLAQRPRAVEELKEVWLGDAPAVESTLKDLKGDEKAPAVVLFRLKARAIGAPDAGTAKRLNSSGGANDYLGELLGADRLPANWAIVAQKDGRAPDNSAGLVDAIPTSATEEALAKISAWSFDVQRCQSATLALTGALSTAAKDGSTTILLVDVGENQSSLIAISAQGVTGFSSIPVGFDALAEATQGALGLKFRGSAARLMFNESYDFSDSAGKIVEPLANAVRTALPSLGAAPAQIVISGVLARQTWLTQALISAVGLKNFTPNLSTWTAAQGLALGSKISPEVAPSWFGVLGAIASYEPRNPGASTPWNPVFTNTPVAPAAVVSALIVEPPVVPPPPKAVITPPAPKPAEPVPAIKVEPPKAVIKPAEPVAPPKPAVVITPPPKPVEPPKPVAPAKTPPPPAKPIEPKPPVKTEPKPVAKAPVKPEPAKAPAPAAAAKPTLSPAPAPVTPKIATGAPFPQKKSSLPIIIAVVVIVAILGAGYYFHVKNQKEIAQQQMDLAAAQKRNAEQAASARADQEKAQREIEAQKKEAEEAAKRAVAAEKARIEGEARARQSTAEELLNARGSLTVNTNPTGATVAIGELAPRTSPVNVKDLRLGRYSVTITLAGYDPEQRDVDIKANAVTDLGTIALHRQIGAVEITSEPDGLDYELKPAGALFVNPADVRKGKTPATLNDVPAGSYQLTITKPNWPTYTTNVKIERNGTEKVQGMFAGGTIVINSNVPGAKVLKGQTQIGVTPLTLNDVTPGDVSFTLAQSGADPVTVSGRVEPGKTLTLTGTLLDSDRIMKLSELDERPFPTQQVEPDLSSGLRNEGGSATIEFVVGTDGVPTDLRVLNASNPAFGRACLAAAAKWRFRAGMVHGKAVRTHITLPFRMAPDT